MCCLFGLIDYRHSLTVKQKNRILSALAVAAEARGTDATGIAYNSGGKLRIYKRPWPAHYMRFRVPEDAAVVMGHTRMTTQGSEHRNSNNHPFPGKAGTKGFALAHNGMLYNDKYLRSSLNLPKTKIETDSYIAVQLIEHKKALDLTSLKYMAEQVEGSFCFTVLDQENSLYIVKGDNPLCLYHFPALGLYVYASTEDILQRALNKAHLSLGIHQQLSLRMGEVLRINTAGKETRQTFDTSNLSSPWGGPIWQRYHYHGWTPSALAENEHLNELRSVCMAFGFTPEDIDKLARQGFTAEELEELLYGGGLY